jgi:hypothetical protein
VFLTDDPLLSSNFGGLSGADAVCNSRASGAGLSGTFKAWLSDSSASPSTRFTRSSKGYALIDGTMIADDWDDLTDGPLATPITTTENGVVDPTPRSTATSTDADGTGLAPEANAYCLDWTSDSGTPNATQVRGRTNVTDSTWTNSNTAGCGNTIRLYCFEQ